MIVSVRGGPATRGAGWCGRCWGGCLTLVLILVGMIVILPFKATMASFPSRQRRASRATKTRLRIPGRYGPEMNKRWATGCWGGVGSIPAVQWLCHSAPPLRIHPRCAARQQLHTHTAEAGGLMLVRVGQDLREE